MKALVVVDYQVDFVNGALGFEGAELLEPIIVRKIEETRAEGGKIIFTLDTHNENYLETAEGKKLPVPHCIDGSDGHRLYGKVADCVDTRDDLVIKKRAFGSMALAVILKKFSFDEVELCGLVTDICVVSNAIIAKAALPEAKIVVDSSACGSGNRQAHENALCVMRGVQIDVI
ncbi:MAG: cysteine hydrolase [Oscillospiraceae bacterium]|nr:cysteine hydrolase [Oscillospiraceae bacterium]